MDVVSKSTESSDCQEFELETEEIQTPSSSNFNSLPGVAYYSCKNYPEQSMKMMQTYWLQEKMCDIDILLEDDDQPIRAHRVVLAAASPYFRAMFTSGFEDASKQCIQIKGISKVIMLQVLKFAYSGKVRMVSDDNVCELLTAANMLQVREITEACSRYMESQLDPSNCIGIFRFSEQHDLKKLQRKAETYIYENFTEVCQNDEFLDLKFCEMLHMLKNENFRKTNDCRIFEACLRWIRRDCVNRKVWMRPILQVLRCYFSSVDYLEELIQTCPLIREKQDCVEYIQKIVQDLNQKKFFYRVPASNQSEFPFAMYVVGGYHVNSLSNCDVFNASDGTWIQKQHLPVARSGLAIVFLNNRLFALGGRVHQRDSDVPIQDVSCVHILDVQHNTWSEGPSLIIPRHRLSAVSLDGYIYAIGGSYHTTALNSVERFDPKTNLWCLRTPMSVARTGHGCTTCNGKIYVVGGCNGTDKLDSVEVYDPNTDKWTIITPLSEPRSGLGAASLGGCIFAIGGCENSGQVSKVERYSIERGEWHNISSLQEARSGHSVITMANKIYALGEPKLAVNFSTFLLIAPRFQSRSLFQGGFTGNEFLTSVEVYNHVENEWCSAPPLLSPRSGHAAAVPV